MDTRKDIQNNSALVAVSGRGIEATNALVAKKTERLATALYLVTSFLSDSEPMKARLRTLSLDLVRDASSVRYGSNIATESAALDALKGNIAETLSLLELSFVAGLVSEMNFTILKREYHTLRDKLELKRASRDSQSDTLIGGSFFAVGEMNGESVAPKYGADKKVVGDTFPPKLSQGHSIGQSPVAAAYASRTQQPTTTPTVGKDSTQRADQVAVKRPTSVERNIPQGHSKDTHTNDIARESRKARIIKLVKDNGEVTIKDISNHFPELSEKTIQRELIAFVEAGILKKAGERRWSRYSIA